MITFPPRSFRTSLSGVVSEGVAEVETADVAYPVDARIDKAIDEAQTREDLIDTAIETAGWTKTSCPLLAGEGLDVAFPQVLDAAEEGDLGFGQPVAGCQLQIGKFKRTKDVGQLKEAVARWRHLRHEFRLGRKRRERLLENRRDLCLTVVVEDLQPFVSVKSLRVCNEKGEDLLKQGVVHRFCGGDETFVHVKAFVREFGLSCECQASWRR